MDGSVPAVGIPDLGALKHGPSSFPEELKADIQQAAEIELGLRCRGCKRRVTHGFEFAMFALAFDPQMGPGAQAAWMTACSGALQGDEGEPCTYAAELTEQGALAMREIKQVFLDEAAP